MAKGDGSITEEKRRNGKSFNPKHWRVCVSLGTDPITKERIKVQEIVVGTKAEARKTRDRIKAEHENGLTVEGEKITFGKFANDWHEARVTAGEVGATRLKREKSIIDELCSYMGDVRIRQITPHAIEFAYTKIRQDKIEKRDKISGTTMNMYHKLLKQILAKAVDYDIILRNPADRVSAPKCDTAERKSLTAEEARNLLKAINECENEAYAELASKQRRPNNEPSRLQGLSRIGNVVGARIALATGMRRGEIVGLSWGDVDLNNKRLRVTKSVTVLGEVKQPKSEAGKRIINLDDSTVSHLKTWKACQAEELEKICIEQGPNTPVCCSDTGDFMNPNNFSRWWRDFASAHGFEHLKLHELRHTQATQLLANGLDMKTVQRRLGHSSATLTLNLYAHALPEMDEKAADCIGSLLSSEPEANEVKQELRRKTA